MKKVLVRRIRNARPRVRVSGHQSGGLRLMDTATIKQFNPSLLQLGDVGVPSQEREAMAAFFDLTGFTAFCNQVDAYLAIPRFLSGFLEWFFTEIRQRVTQSVQGDATMVWAELPTKVKFLGDGLLNIWNTQRMTDENICRLVISCYEICRAYRREFYPAMANKVNKPPVSLRCGMARGKVFTVGNGNDYVGHCINNASRLSHLHSLTFAFPHRGFPVREVLSEEYLRLFVPKYVPVRGVGESEIVWVVRKEFEELPEQYKVNFRNVEQGSRRPGDDVRR